VCVRPAAPQVGSFTVVFRLLSCDTLISISISNMLTFFRPVVAAGYVLFSPVDFPFLDSLIVPHFLSIFHLCDLRQPQVEILNFSFFDIPSVTFSFSYVSYDFLVKQKEKYPAIVAGRRKGQPAMPQVEGEKMKFSRLGRDLVARGSSGLRPLCRRTPRYSVLTARAAAGPHRRAPHMVPIQRCAAVWKRSILTFGMCTGR